MTLDEAKKAQRQQGIAARRALDPSTRRAADAAICARIASLPAWQAAKRVLGYAAFGGEPDLSALLEGPEGRLHGAAWPVCGPDCTMTAARPTRKRAGRRGRMASVRRCWNGRRSSRPRPWTWFWCPVPPLTRPAGGWAWAKATMTGIFPGAPARRCTGWPMRYKKWRRPPRGRWTSAWMASSPRGGFTDGNDAQKL